MGIFHDKWNADDLQDLNNRVMIVTGSTDGLGLAACKDLAKHNAHVIMAYRNPDKIKG